MVHLVKDWLEMHNLTYEKARYIVEHNPTIYKTFTPPKLSLPIKKIRLETALMDYVFPSLGQYFQNEALIKTTLDNIKFETEIDDNKRPSIEDFGADQNLLIRIPWLGTNKDIVLLTHEVTHALQITCSNHVFMPPLAREICAFCGEIMLLNYANDKSHRLFERLFKVWLYQNHVYYDKMKVSFLNQISDETAPYHYDLNYPLARLMAYHIIKKEDGETVLKLFESGDKAVELLDYEYLRMSVEDD